MFTHQNKSRVSIIATLVVLSYSSWLCMSLEESINVTYSADFLPAVATWYGDPNGPGSVEGECGLGDNVAGFPYYGMISAGNGNIFKSGKGCGVCFQVRCTENQACSGRPIIVTITDECPGACNNEAVHFDLSGKAFGYLAKDGLSDALRKAGRINIQYKRVRCLYKASLGFKTLLASNQYYLSFAVENVNGDGDVGHIQILPSNQGATWFDMQPALGATWKVVLRQGTVGPYSLKLTNAASNSSVIASNVIPSKWAPGVYYASTVNFP